MRRNRQGGGPGCLAAFVAALALWVLLIQIVAAALKGLFG